MYCPKCGTENLDSALRCQNCGFVLQEETIFAEKPVAEVVITKESKEVIRECVEPQTPEGSEADVITSKLSATKKLRVSLWIAAAAVLLLSFIAAANFAVGGAEISEIKSVGGKTLEEAYYAELFQIYGAYAWLSAAFGIFMSGILTYLGFRVCHLEESKEQ